MLQWNLVYTRNKFDLRKNKMNKSSNISVLPDFLRYRTSTNLIRLGKANDGGYLVSRKDIEVTDHLIGLGMGYDWSFERDFLKLRSVPLSMFDASVRPRLFLKNAYLTFVQLKIGRSVKSILTLIQYLLFFQGNRSHHALFVGPVTSRKEVTLTKILENANSDNVFLKIDIEGGEYRILDSLVRVSHKISGMAIEFHDCDLHMSKIESFVKNVPLSIVHIHANNYATIDPLTKVPLVLEITFSKHSLKEGEPVFPHPLDQPNNPRAPEIQLGFH